MHGDSVLEGEDTKDRGVCHKPCALYPLSVWRQVVRMHEDVVVEWEAAEDRHVAVPEAAGGGVQIVCDGAATALEVAPAVTPEAAEVVELVAQRISGLREKAAEVGGRTPSSLP